MNVSTESMHPELTYNRDGAGVSLRDTTGQDTGQTTVDACGYPREAHLCLDQSTLPARAATEYTRLHDTTIR